MQTAYVVLADRGRLMDRGVFQLLNSRSDNFCVSYRLGPCDKARSEPTVESRGRHKNTECTNGTLFFSEHAEKQRIANKKMFFNERTVAFYSPLSELVVR